MIDTVALREKVLDLAIRGKLVPQDPNDEPASVLLERIRAQKQQMVKDGKLKAKDIKDDSVIFVGEDNLHYEKFADGSVECVEETLGYELPSGWTFTTIGVICSLQAGKFVSASDISPVCLDNMYPCYGGNGIRGYVEHYTLDGDYPIIGRQGALCGNVNMAHGKFYATEHAVVVTPMIDIDLDWLYHILVGLNLNQYAAGAAQPGLAVSNVLKVKLPLPPANEQKRIAEAVDDALVHIEKLNEAKNDFSSIIALIKSKILDLAIRGKLVSQNPNDESASVLLERIRAEKEDLIRQGKIKRDKKESVIFKGEDNSYYEKISEKVICIDDELSFSVPESWSWTRLGNIVLNYDNQRRPITKHNRINDLGLYDYYGATGAIDKVDSYIFDGEYLMIGEDGGNFFTQRDNSFIASGRFWANNHVHIVQPVACNIWYLKHFLDSCDLALMGLITGIGVPKLNQENMNKILVPIPPIEEQDRIADKVKEIYSVLSNAEKSLV